MRISNRYMSNHMLNNIQNNLSKLARSQEQIATGSKLLRPSDNPNAISEFLKIKATLSYNEQYKVNIDDGLSYLEMADTSMGTLGDILLKAKELALQSANDTYNTEQRVAIAEQIDKLIDEAVDLANSTVGGKYIYAGKDNGNPPFERNGDKIIYKGDFSEITREVLAGTDYVIAEAGVTLAPAQMGLYGTCVDDSGEYVVDQGVFSSLFQLRDILANSETVDFDNEIQTSIADLSQQHDHVLQKRTATGARYRHFDSLKKQLLNQELILTQNLSNIEDADIARLSIEAAQQQLSYNASLAIGAQMMQTSLLNFLR
ncbi:flagellar hook-associated protein FlgL [Peptococcaceae bacterium 1198_IL3148]